MVPLQAGSPIGPELFIIGGLTLIMAAVSVAISVYIYRDAERRNSSHPLAWGVAAFVGGFWVWVLYYIVRDSVGSGLAGGEGQQL